MIEHLEDFERHVADLATLALAGDEFSARSLGCLAILAAGYFTDGGGPDGGEVIDLSHIRLQRAA